MLIKFFLLKLTIHQCTQLSSVLNIRRLLQLVEQQIDRLQTMQLAPMNIPNDQSQPVLNDMDMMLNNPQQLTSDDTLRFCLSLIMEFN